MKQFFDGMREALGSDFFVELNKELDKSSSELDMMIHQYDVQLDNFIASSETDIEKMDSAIDPLFDYIGVEEAEEVIRKYIAYLSKVDAEYAEERLDVLEDTFGYKSVIVYAAGLMAAAFGSLNEGCESGNQSFARLLEEAKNKDNWKEKVALFIHHCSKNTKCSVQTLMEMLKDNTDKLVNTPEESWYQRWMDDLMDWDADTTHPLTDKEVEEITRKVNYLIGTA